MDYGHAGDSGILEAISKKSFRPISALSPRFNYHPRSGRLEFSATGRKGKSTSVLSTLNLHPGAKHPVCFARIKSSTYVSMPAG